MYCSKCGAPYEPGDKFCEKCGANLETVQTQSANQTTDQDVKVDYSVDESQQSVVYADNSTQQQIATPNKKKKGKKVGIIVGVVAAVLVVVGIALFFILGGTKLFNSSDNTAFATYLKNEVIENEGRFNVKDPEKSDSGVLSALVDNFDTDDSNEMITVTMQRRTPISFSSNSSNSKSSANTNTSWNVLLSSYESEKIEDEEQISYADNEVVIVTPEMDDGQFNYVVYVTENNDKKYVVCESLCVTSDNKYYQVEVYSYENSLFTEVLNKDFELGSDIENCTGTMDKICNALSSYCPKRASFYDGAKIVDFIKSVNEEKSVTNICSYGCTEDSSKCNFEITDYTDIDSLIEKAQAPTTETTSREKLDINSTEVKNLVDKLQFTITSEHASMLNGGSKEEFSNDDILRMAFAKTSWDDREYIGDNFDICYIDADVIEQNIKDIFGDVDYTFESFDLFVNGDYNDLLGCDADGFYMNYVYYNKAMNRFEIYSSNIGVAEYDFLYHQIAYADKGDDEIRIYMSKAYVRHIYDNYSLDGYTYKVYSDYNNGAFNNLLTSPTESDFYSSFESEEYTSLYFDSKQISALDDVKDKLSTDCYVFKKGSDGKYYLTSYAPDTKSGETPKFSNQKQKAMDNINAQVKKLKNEYGSYDYFDIDVQDFDGDSKLEAVAFIGSTVNDDYSKYVNASVYYVNQNGYSKYSDERLSGYVNTLSSGNRRFVYTFKAEMDEGYMNTIQVIYTVVDDKLIEINQSSYLTLYQSPIGTLYGYISSEMHGYYEFTYNEESNSFDRGEQVNDYYD